jgi:hypothetical protein
MANQITASFDQVFRCLSARGTARVVSSRGTEYTVSAEDRDGRKTIVGRPRSGEVRVHADCWGRDMTCEGTLAGGLFNGAPSIYDWYRQNSGN